jgi:hypothetical protein
MGISWILLIAVVIIAVQHACFSRFGFAGLQYSRQFHVTHCFAEDEVEMVETIVNRKLLPLPWLRLESMMPAGLQFQQQHNLAINTGTLYQNHNSLFSLMPYSKIIRRHRIRCMKRGWYRLDSAALSVGDFLGQQAATRGQKLNLQLLVYPKLIAWSELPLPSSSWQGDITVKRWIVQDPFQSSGVREYRYGDTLNSIHWKATARTNTLQVHNREYTADPRLMIILNTQITETMWDAVSDPELVEQGLSYAATLVDRAISQGIPAGFGCNGYTEEAPQQPIYLEPHNGSDYLNMIYETMAKFVVSCCRTFDDYLENEIQREGTALDFVLITPYVSASIEQQIEQLRMKGHSVEIMLLRHEV